MAVPKRKLGLQRLLGVIVLAIVGIVLIQRIWTFQSALRDAQGNAAHLEKLYEEALDEAADWRNKYDLDMKEVKEALQEKSITIETLQVKMDTLKKIKDDLEEKFDALNNQLMMEKEKYQKLSSTRETRNTETAV